MCLFWAACAFGTIFVVLRFDVLTSCCPVVRWHANRQPTKAGLARHWNTLGARNARQCVSFASNLVTPWSDGVSSTQYFRRNIFPWYVITDASRRRPLKHRMYVHLLHWQWTWTTCLWVQEADRRCYERFVCYTFILNWINKWSSTIVQYQMNNRVYFLKDLETPVENWVILLPQCVRPVHVDIG